MSSAAVPPKPYGPDDLARDVPVSRETLARLQAHAALLRQWQPRINLVGPATLADLWRRHFLDSAQLFQFLPSLADDITLLDMGSGAGFPGLVLAAMGVGHVHLAESDGRKAVFLRAAARAMDISARVSVHDCRLEALDLPPVDVITARALAPLEKLLAWGRPFVGVDTIWLLPKGVHVDEELTAARASWKMQLVQHPSLADREGCVLVIKKVEPHGR